MPNAMLVSDPLASTLILLALLWVAAKIGGEAAVRLKLPAVAGQLSVGVVLAALPSFIPGFPKVAESAEAHVLAYMGIVIMMFMVGLEASVAQMLKVGWASLRVAVVGVVGPMALGLMASFFLLKDMPFAVDLFIGACLCATSIGISAQVLRERNAAGSREGRVIIGAAVIDDVLGLLVLVAVSGIAVSTMGPAAANEGARLLDPAQVADAASAGAGQWGELVKTLVMAFLFLASALTVGRWLSPRVFKVASRFRSQEILLPLAIAFAFSLAYLGSLVGLATIVGAYAAGLILEHSHVEMLQERENNTLEEMVKPVVALLVPLFFVLTGASVDASVLVKRETLILAGVLTAVGILGKYVSGYVAGGGLKVSMIGWGMVPRGEVGLIFVAVGSSIKNADGDPFLAPEIQAGVLGAILMTTILGPIGLSWVLGRGVGKTG